MTQSPAPEAVLELISCGCKKAKCQCNCSCSRQSMACTEVCVCTGGEDCLNPHKVVIADSNESDITDDSDLDILICAKLHLIILKILEKINISAVDVKCVRESQAQTYCHAMHHVDLWSLICLYLTSCGM